MKYAENFEKCSEVYDQVPIFYCFCDKRLQNDQRNQCLVIKNLFMKKNPIITDYRRQNSSTYHNMLENLRPSNFKNPSESLKTTISKTSSNDQWYYIYNVMIGLFLGIILVIIFVNKAYKQLKTSSEFAQANVSIDMGSNTDSRHREVSQCSTMDSSLTNAQGLTNSRMQLQPSYLSRTTSQFEENSNSNSLEKENSSSSAEYKGMIATPLQGSSSVRKQTGYVRNSIPSANFSPPTVNYNYEKRRGSETMAKNLYRQSFAEQENKLKEKLLEIKQEEKSKKPTNNSINLNNNNRAGSMIKMTRLFPRIGQNYRMEEISISSPELYHRHQKSKNNKK